MKLINFFPTGSYTPEIITNMTEALNRNAIVQPVTFPVRAAIAAQSIDTLSILIGSSTPGTTLTIWHSSDSDHVDIHKLRILLEKIGRDKIYLDVPEKMKLDINFDSGSSIALVSPILLLLAGVHLLL